MASAAVMAAVEAVLASNWTHTPIISPNTVGKVPKDNSAFLTVEYPVANEEQKSFGAPGSNTYREEGGFRLVLSVPIGVGLSPYAGWMDTLRSVFRGSTFSGITVFEAPPPFINDESDDGAYIKMSIVVLYRFDING